MVAEDLQVAEVASEAEDPQEAEEDKNNNQNLWLTLADKSFL